MDLDDLARHVGEERFQLACEWAWKTAAGTGRTPYEEWPGDLAFVPHDLEEVVWDSPGEWKDRVDLAFALYERMPSYANLMYTTHYVERFDAAAAAAFWDCYRFLLGHDDDRLADPIAYSLWCDYFEEGDRVEVAWRRLTDPLPGERGLSRLLRASGPVPWGLKAPLLRRLVREPARHAAIFDALQSAATDIYGDIDRLEAQRLLARLQLRGRGDARRRLAEQLAQKG